MLEPIIRFPRIFLVLQLKMCCSLWWVFPTKCAALSGTGGHWKMARCFLTLESSPARERCSES